MNAKQTKRTAFPIKVHTALKAGLKPFISEAALSAVRGFIFKTIQIFSSGPEIGQDMDANKNIYLQMIKHFFLFPFFSYLFLFVKVFPFVLARAVFVPDSND